MNDVTVSFTATDVALDDEPTSTPSNRSDTSASRLVVKNTSAEATIDLDATWRVGTGTGADDNGTTTGTGTATSTSSPLRGGERHVSPGIRRTRRVASADSRRGTRT